MAIFKLPLSGNVSQQINPWSWFSDMTSGQFGMININLGHSEAPEVEQEILERVGSYGRQMGKMCEVLQVLVKHIPENADLSEAEREALDSFDLMMRNIDAVKKAAGRKCDCDKSNK